MPLLLVAGGILTAAGTLLGFTVGGGVKGASNGIKYAVLGVGAFVVAKQLGLLKK